MMEVVPLVDKTFGGIPLLKGAEHRTLASPLKYK